MNLVIDASVLVKFYIPEVLADRAEGLLAKVEQGKVTLWAPDLIYAETGNILWKKHRLNELNRLEVGKITESMGQLPIKTENSKMLLPLALELAIGHGITVYDALYVSMAKVYEAPFLTADRKLVGRMGQTDFKKYTLWLGHYE